MDILIVSATINECVDLIKSLDLKQVNAGFYQNKIQKKNISLLISGIGLVFTSYSLSKVLFKKNYDLVINIGIAGSFKDEPKIGDVVEVTSDLFADLGIRNKNRFIDIFEAGFIDANKFPFEKGELKSSDIEHRLLKKIKKVKAVSVNTVSGNKNEIEALKKKYNAAIESMEGAAVFFVCKHENIPVLQIRSISNYVEERDKNRWNIPLAIKELNNFCISFIETL